MKVCVLGDLHGAKLELPDAELYMGVGDLSSLGDDPAHVRKRFYKAMGSTVDAMEKFFRSRWERDFMKYVSRTYSEIYEWLNSTGRPVFLVSGNREVIVDVLVKEFQQLGKGPYELVREFKNIQYIDNKAVDFHGLKIYGLPFIPSDEPYIPAYERSQPFKERFDALRSAAVPGKPDIILSHSPPRGTLDKHSVAGYVGSAKVLAILNRKRPRYLFCGHIHESKGMMKVGSTTVVNLGTTYELFDL